MENEFYAYQTNLSDEDLVRIAYFERGKMKKAARISARTILEERNLSKSYLKQIKAEIRRQKRTARRDKLSDNSIDFDIFDFILDYLFSNIGWF